MRMPMKKITAALLSLTMVILLLPVSARAADTYLNFTYKTYDGKTVEIISYTGKDSTVVIPDKINNLPVTTIGAAAFANNTSITSIEMTKITDIKDRAFVGCSNLTKVWSYGLKTIGASAFENCSKLTTMILPQGLTTIGADAFLNCNQYISVDVPASVTSLGDHSLGYIGVSSVYVQNLAVTINTASGSAAETYARANGLKFTVDGAAPVVTTPLTTAVISDIPAQPYTGSAVKPALTVKLGTLQLKQDTDYTVDYKNNVEVGTATVTITGIGKYSGTKTATFQIINNKISVTASDLYLSYSDKARSLPVEVTLSPSTATFTFKASGDGIEVKKKNSHSITVDLEEGFTGSASITLTVRADGYETVTKTITVFVPNGSKISSVERTGNTTAEVKWSKVSNITGYELQYSTSNTFNIDRESKTLSTNSCKLKSLTKGQTYYVRVRTYFEKDGQPCYSKWSTYKKLSATVPPARLYANYLKKQANKVEKILAFTTADLDGDGVEELLYQYYNGGNRNAGAVCTIKDGVVKQLHNKKNGSPIFFLSDNTQLMLKCSNDSKSTYHYIYVMKDGALKRIHTYKILVNQNGKNEYYLDGKKIKYSEFKTMKQSFKKMKMATYTEE